MGSLIGLLIVTPALFRHPASGFAGFRYTVGATMFLAVAGMVVFLKQGEWVLFFILSALFAALGWAAALYLLKQMNQRAGLSKRQRRKQTKKQAPLWRAAVIWVGLLISTVGIAFTIIEGP